MIVDQLPRLGKRELICLLLFTCNYVVSVWRGFIFLWVLGMGYVILLWHSLSLPLIILPVRKDVSRFARMAKNIFPSTLSNEIVLNRLPVLEFCSFGVNISSTSFQEAGTPPSASLAPRP